MVLDPNTFVATLTVGQLLELLRTAVAPAPADAPSIPQRGSPLGVKGHCSAVRRRIAEGLHGASVVGRKHLLSHAALVDELERVGQRSLSAQAPDAADRLRAELAGGAA